MQARHAQHSLCPRDVAPGDVSPAQGGRRGPPRRTRLLVIWLLLCCALWPGLGLAADVTVLLDGNVPQYREAQVAAKGVIPDAQIVEVSAPDMKAQLERQAAAGGVVLAIGHKAMLAAQASGATVVFCMVLGPSASPAKNVTGLRLEVAPSLQFGFIKRVAPAARRLGMIYDARSWSAYAKEAMQAATAQGITLVPRPVSDAKEVRAALAEIAGNIDALWLIPDPSLVNVEIFNFLLVFTLERKLALFGFFADFTRRGALASVAPDYAEIGKQAAKLAAELAGKPAESRSPLPASLASPGGLTINAKTARQLGIELSDEVQATAKQVYR
jgi:putative ABC transport system substrate-binding protein